LKKVYHLSHIDLDGDSCQLLTHEVFENIEFFNANYGAEVGERLNQILDLIKNSNEQKILILITDLNLSLDEAKFLDDSIKSIDKDIEILLLDHHKSGQEVSQKYSWYFLDTNRSATKITYDYFKTAKSLDKFDEYVECVNAYDIWLSDKKTEFEIGKVLARYVMSAKELNRVMFANESFEYILHLIKSGFLEVDKKDAHIVLDDKLHEFKKSFFKRDKNDTLENLVSDYIVDILSAKKDEFSIFYKDKKGLLTYSIGNSSIIGNDFLTKNPEFDFFLDINSRKNISLRANNKIDVSLFAKEVFEGGGHANASGGKFSEFKDSFIYENIKRQIEEKLLEYS